MNKDRLIRNKKLGISGDETVTKSNFQAILDVRYLKSVVEAGEAVGVVAGQSIGEPSTQMTLNTFHLAGHSAKNVTLGIPRLREIVMTAARNLATPTMTLRMSDDLGPEEARKFAKGISRLSLAEVLDKVTVTESTGRGSVYGEAKKYEIRLDFFPKEEYGREYAVTVEDLVGAVEHRYLPRLQALTRKELKKRGDEKSVKAGEKAKDDALPEVGKSAGTVEQSSARPDADREGGDDDSDGEGDDDATKDKVKGNRQQAGYEAYEDEEEEELGRKNRKDEDGEEMEDEAYGGSPREPSSSSDDSDAEDERQAMRSAAKDRETRIKAHRKTNDVTRFAFDDAKGDSCTFTLEYDSSTAKILMLHLVETAARASLIQSVSGIAAAVLDSEATAKSPAQTPVVATSGVNIPAMWHYQHLVNPNHIYTNSIHDTLAHYGVEAARASIVVELQAVFGGHGISVDTRHLTLIADFMTRDGGYGAFSRMGYRGNVSPFMKMSFETTVGVLKEAVLDGDADELGGPSGRIVVGRLGKMGTGGFDVFMPLETSRQGGNDAMEIDG